MGKFQIIVRTATRRICYVVRATSSSAAWLAAANAQGDVPCGITAKPTKAAQ